MLFVCIVCTRRYDVSAGADAAGISVTNCIRRPLQHVQAVYAT